MRLVFDIEANGLYEKATKIWCICAEDIDTGEKYEWTIENTGRPCFLDYATELVGHNILNYDLPLLKKLWEWEQKDNVKVTDTLVMSRLLNPDRGKPTGYAGKGGPHSLEAWGYRVGKGKPDHEDWSVFSTDMLRRCREDVGINVLTYHTLSGEMRGHDWERSMSIEHEMARIITEQEHHGICFDSRQARAYCDILEERIAAIDADLVPQLPHRVKQIGSVPINRPFLKTGGYTQATKKYLELNYEHSVIDDLVGGPFTRVEFIPFDLGSVQQVKQYLLDNGWRPDNWNYSKTTGERTSPKLDGEFEGVDGDLPKRVRERITWRHRKSQIEGWLGNLREDGRLSAGANPCGTNTGRMRHRTVVNVPKANTDKEGNLIWDTEKQKDIFGTQMRSLFVAPEGYKIVGHDASGLELRMLAHFMEDEEYINQILTGDIHEFNRNAAGLPNRDAAKTFIYAFNYGAGDAKLGSIIGGDATDGAELRAKFLDSLPKLEKLINRVKRASGKGYLKGLDDRKIMMRRGSDDRIMRHKALNTLLQGSGAIVMKQSCIMLWDEVRRANLNAHKILDMHDEGQAEVLIEHVEPYKEIAVNSVVNAGEHFRLRIPLAAEAKVGLNLAETH